MHELSLVEEMVSKCLALAHGRTVLEVRARCSDGIDAAEVSESFSFLVAGQGSAGGDTCLTGARLALETVPAVLRCACGFNGELPHDNVAGHLGICPECGHVSEQGGGLEVLGISFAGAGASGPT